MLRTKTIMGIGAAILLAVLLIAFYQPTVSRAAGDIHGDDHHDMAGETVGSGHDEHDDCETHVDEPGHHDEHEGHDDDDHDDHDEHDHDAHVDEDDHDGHDHEAHVDEDDDDHDDHDEHDHDAHAEDDNGHEAHTDEDDDHTGHDHTSHDHGAHEDVVRLSGEGQREIGLEIARAGAGSLDKHVVLPGTVVINSDRMAHIVPRVPGIVREVYKSVGDRVRKGEILAWIESDELAEAKLEFFMKTAELGCCEIKLTRSRDIFKNVTKLLELLGKEASNEAINRLDGLEMGEYRGQLLSAYAEYLAAREIHEQEKHLRARDISSNQELLEAETSLKKARGTFLAAMDTARYETMFVYGETIQERQVAEFEAVAAEKRLRLKGAGDAVVGRLRAMVPKPVQLTPCDCGDPNCRDDNEQISVSKTLNRDDRFAWDAITAPFDGYIIEKHITLGEKLGDDVDAFTVADLGTVWIDLSVHQKDLALVRSGLAVTISRGREFADAAGVIEYVSPIIDAETRTALARVVMPNPHGRWRPGTFVTAQVEVGIEPSAVVVPSAAVQELHGGMVVFVKTAGGFEPRSVTVGRTDGQRTEIVSGLLPGQEYVSRGAFELKAELVTSNLGSHAGHGH